MVFTIRQIIRNIFQYTVPGIYNDTRACFAATDKTVGKQSSNADSYNHKQKVFDQDLSFIVFNLRTYLFIR